MIDIKPNAFATTIFNSIKGMDDKVKHAIRMGAYESGKEMVDFAKKNILSKNKTGRLYRIRRGSRIRNHRASSKNEFPASISGALHKSLSFRVQGTNLLEIGAGASKSGTGNAAKYARILEVGGNAGIGGSSKIEARNYIRQTIEKNTKNLEKNIQSQIDRAIK